MTGVQTCALPICHPFFEAVKQACSMQKLNTDTSSSSWWVEALDENIRKATEQEPRGSMSAYRLGEFKKIVKKTMKIEQKLSSFMEDFLTRLEKREIGVMPIQVNEVKSWE